MSYRDDLEAAQARAAAAERRAGLLERRLLSQAADAAAEPPPFAPPVGLQVVRTPTALTMRWQWRWWTQGGVAAVFTIGSVACAVGLLIMGGMTVLAGLGLLLSALMSGYVATAALLNHTTIQASPEGLVISHGPVPWLLRRHAYGADELAQISVLRSDISFDAMRPGIAMNTSQPAWCVRAHLRSGAEVQLTHRIDDRPTALYLEHALERELGLVDRPVLGEDRARALPGAENATGAHG